MEKSLQKEKLQKEIKESVPLLDRQGHLLAPGYCKQNYYVYNKDVLKKGRRRIKEWDYYMILGGRFMSELLFYDLSVFVALCAVVIDLETGRCYHDQVIEPSHPGKYEMSPGADKPSQFTYAKFGRRADFIIGEDFHRLRFDGKYKGSKFKMDITGKRLPAQESLTIATPFKNPRHFFYSQKLNCIQAEGSVDVAGRTIRYDPEKSYMLMDWARGLWPWKGLWYWSNGSTTIDGKLFGFEMTWGFGIEDAATETALFYDGKCHKIGVVRLEHDPERAGWMNPWHFISRDGRLNLIMTPTYCRPNGIIFLGLIGMRSHQVFGKFNGRVILDDDTVLKVKDMPAFAEKVHLRW